MVSGRAVLLGRFQLCPVPAGDCPLSERSNAGALQPRGMVAESGRGLRLGARWRRGLPLLLRPAGRAVAEDVLSGGSMSAGAGHVGRRLVALRKHPLLDAGAATG